MDVIFERSSDKEPKGHALLYFRSTADPEHVLGTYVVVLPIAVDISKYVPPFLMNQVGDLGPKDMSAFAFPPAPESIESRASLERMATIREDDILFGGSVNPTDVPSALMSVNEAVQWYADICSQGATQSQPEVLSPVEEAASGGLGINEVLYSLMSDNDKLSELTTLVGRLRYAQESGEGALMKEAEQDINLLAEHLPENHQTPRLIEAAKSGGSRGAALADLYLQRCFHLAQEEYVKLGRVEEQIRALRAEDSPGQG